MMRNGALAVALMVLCGVAGRAQEAAPAATTASPAAVTDTSTATTTPIVEKSVTATDTLPAVASTPVASPSVSPASEPTASSPAAATAKETKTAAGKTTVALPPEKAQPVRVTRFETPPVIDGKLDEAVWKGAVVLKDFYQIQPGDNITPSRPTEVMIGYDAKSLYFGFRAFDEPDKVRATVAKRDEVFGEDNIRIFLDTFNDQRKAYVFGWNALGVQQDGILTEGAGTDFSVDIVMESKGTLTETGYIVEVAIPFKSLRYEAGKDKLWGFHVWRNIDRFNDELDSWMPISRDKSGTMNQAGHITGLEGISTERTLELIPSLTLSETGKRVRTLLPSAIRANAAIVDPGRFVNGPLDFDPGLTAKLGITPTITLDLALNPDFAQVEADQTVITANQRFPIFFEEKRPFFLEGIDIFRTRISAVNTRTIIDPDVAVKLSGKRGRNSFGLLLASDNAPGNFSEEERTDPDIRPGIEKFLDKNAYIGVLRLKRDIGKENSIGLIATTYNFIEKHNHMGGFDGRFRLNPVTTLDVQVLGSTSRRFFFDPDLGQRLFRTGNGLAYSFGYNNNGRHFGYEIFGTGRSKDFRADVGFNRRLNTNNEGIFVRYNSEPKPKAKLISWRIYNSSQTNFDWQGRSQFYNSETQLSFRLQRQTFFGVGFEQGYERLFEEEFGQKRTATRAGTFAGDDTERSSPRKAIYAYIETLPSKKYSAFIFSSYTMGALDLDFGAGPKFPRVSPAALTNPDAPQDPGPGKSLFIDSSVSYKPIDSLRASLSYVKSRLVRDDTNRVAFDDNIFSLRSTYQFTRFTFARARIDYTTLSARARAQMLLGWTPNPGTSFFVGYNDDLNRNGTNPFTGQIEPGLRRNGRTFFIKMSYLFRRSI